MNLEKVEQHSDPLQLMLSASSASSPASSTSPNKEENATENKLIKDAKNIKNNSKDYEVNLIQGFEDLVTGALICKKNKLHYLSLL